MDKEYNNSQMMKGILEGCILLTIKNKMTYGYEILQKLQEYDIYSLNEGTLYPLLLRLEKRKLIVATLKPSPLGPKRKYFALTEKGHLYLKEFLYSWRQVCNMVDVLIESEVRDEDCRYQED